MGTGPKALPPRLKAVFVVPVIVCLAILWSTGQLYGSCVAPARVASVEALHTYLLDTSQALRRRNTTAADALQQLADSIAESAPKAATLEQELNKTRGYLQDSKEKIIEHIVEITSLKQKTGELDQAKNAANSAKQEVEKLQQQLKEKEEQLKKEQEKQQQQSHEKEQQLKQDVEKLQQQLKEKEEQQKQEVEKLQQQVKEKEEQLTKQPAQSAQQQQQQQQVATAPLAEDAAFGRMHIMEMAGLQCNPVKDQEFGGDQLIGGTDHRAADASECCASCHAYNAAVERGGTEKGRNASRCNTWAFCADKEVCKERWGECWVKHQKAALPPPPALPPDAHANKGWISGVIYPEEVLKQQDNGSYLVMHTAHGDATIQLLPELAPASVRELKRAAEMQANSISRCSNCRIYRPEPNFLIQGLLEAPGSYVAVPRYPSPQQPMVMPRGMVCWAGGTGGPHWFVNLVDQAGFKDSHLCWGQVKDMTLFDKILTLPRKDKKPGAMEELVEHVRYNISVTTA